MNKRNFSISIVFTLILISSTTISSQQITNEDTTIVLVIGFGPFLIYDVNPSELIAAELDGEIINGAEIVGLQIQPNLSNFTESIEIAYQAIEDISPDYVFSIGLAAPYERIRIERIGINLKIETGENASLEKLIPNGRWIRISSLPSMKIVRQLRKEGIPSQTGLYAGLSLCNGMLYSVLHYIDVNDLPIKSGFIHVPLHKTEEHPEGMELETMFNATRIIIKTSLEHFS